MQGSCKQRTVAALAKQQRCCCKQPQVVPSPRDPVPVSCVGVQPAKATGHSTGLANAAGSTGYTSICYPLSTLLDSRVYLKTLSSADLRNTLTAAAIAWFSSSVLSSGENWHQLRQGTTRSWTAVASLVSCFGCRKLQSSDPAAFRTAFSAVKQACGSLEEPTADMAFTSNDSATVLMAAVIRLSCCSIVTLSGSLVQGLGCHPLVHRPG